MSDEIAAPDFGLPQWDVPGWDWQRDDFTWLGTHDRLNDNEMSIFFIHGGLIRHQAHIPYGRHGIEEFCALVRERAIGLDDPYVMWLEDTGDGDRGLWVEGTRPPNENDLGLLKAARERQHREDLWALRRLRVLYPDQFRADALPEAPS